MPLEENYVDAAGECRGATVVLHRDISESFRIIPAFSLAASLLP